MTDLDCSSPLYQQVFRWFREKYGLRAFPNQVGGDWFCVINSMPQSDYFITYEEAELACLKKLIETVKNK
jgi:hypothetical protein